jgi:mannose-6-phosphate isomerase
MAEVQQSSDATFRLYDWDRPGPDGKPRPLHVEESLESINWSAGPVDPVPGSAFRDLPPGVSGERLVYCDRFVLDRYRVDGRFEIPGRDTLSIWLVAEGAAGLHDGDGRFRRQFHRGETAIVPASAGRLSWDVSVLTPGQPAVLIAASLP